MFQDRYSTYISVEFEWNAVGNIKNIFKRTIEFEDLEIQT